MKENNLFENVDSILEQLMYLSNECENKDQQKLIHHLRNTLLSHFPENFEQLQFQGRIEDVLLQINEHFENRINSELNDFAIHLNFYLPEFSDFSMNEIEQIKDCIRLYYPKTPINFELNLNYAIDVDKILLLFDFTFD